jgi:hypothetical protein
MNKEEKQLQELHNYVRELEKSLEVLRNVEKYLKYFAQMNAALHLARETVPSPLYGQVIMARNGIQSALRSYKRKVPKIPNTETKDS